MPIALHLAATPGVNRGLSGEPLTAINALGECRCLRLVGVPEAVKEGAPPPPPFLFLVQKLNVSDAARPIAWRGVPGSSSDFCVLVARVCAAFCCA